MYRKFSRAKGWTRQEEQEVLQLGFFSHFEGFTHGPTFPHSTFCLLSLRGILSICSECGLRWRAAPRTTSQLSPISALNTSCGFWLSNSCPGPALSCRLNNRLSGSPLSSVWFYIIPPPPSPSRSPCSPASSHSHFTCS